MKTLKILTLALLSFFGGWLRAEVHIIPQPSVLQRTEGYTTIEDGATIGFNEKELQPAAIYLKEILTRHTSLDISTKKTDGGCCVMLSVLEPDAKDESYTLEASEGTICINARSYRGIINGIATLRQLLPEGIESAEQAKATKLTLPNVQIQDSPNFEWRGLMLDPVRHFYSIEETKELLDQMALYKFNKFHWHLIDDQACRIEFKNYPKLTGEGGAFQPLNHLDKACLQRAKDENNPDFIIPEKFMKEMGGKKLYGGFYTQEEIADVIEYAAIRGIDIVPEIDMPGHNTVACQNYPWLSCKEEGASPLCLGKESTIEYCHTIFDEVFELFPYEYVSIGGDEVDRSRWTKCPDCQKRIKENRLKNEAELQSWFTKKMEVYFNEHGRRLLGWDEILEGGLSKTATVHWWRGDHPDVTQRATAMGNEVVLCPFTFCYFDYPQDNNTLRRIYDGDIVPTDLSHEQLRLIKGMQANIWGEYIPTVARMQFMVFPRALAMAEKAWTPRQNQRWDDFLPRLTHHLKRLKAMGINYRPLQTDKK